MQANIATDLRLKATSHPLTLNALALLYTSIIIDTSLFLCNLYFMNSKIFALASLTKYKDPVTKIKSCFSASSTACAIA